VNNNSNKRSDN